MGMFKLIKDMGDYNVFASSFRQQHHIDPLSHIGGLNPVKYPCLINTVKTLTTHVYRNRDRTIDDRYCTSVINEIYYKSQAKKLVYPPRRQFIRPRSVKINNTEELVELVRTQVDLDLKITNSGRYREWSPVDIDRYNGKRQVLQLKQIDDLYNRVRRYREEPINVNLAFPYLVSFRTVNIESFNNASITVVTFFILTREEAKSLVYYEKNDILIRQRRSVTHNKIIKGVIKRAKKVVDMGENHVPF